MLWQSTPWRGQPGAVVVEVLTDGTDEHRVLAEVGHSERDVGRDPAAPDLQVVGEERQRDLVELLDDERVGEPASEGHQVVGGNGPGDRDLHAPNLPDTTTPGRHR